MTLTDGSDVTLLPSFRLWAECALAWFYKSEDKVFNPERGRWELKTRLKRLVNKQYLIVGRGAAEISICYIYACLHATNRPCYNSTGGNRANYETSRGDDDAICHSHL